MKKKELGEIEKNYLLIGSYNHKVIEQFLNCFGASILQEPRYLNIRGDVNDHFVCEFINGELSRVGHIYATQRKIVNLLPFCRVFILFLTEENLKSNGIERYDEFGFDLGYATALNIPVIIGRTYCLDYPVELYDVVNDVHKSMADFAKRIKKIVNGSDEKEIKRVRSVKKIFRRSHVKSLLDAVDRLYSKKEHNIIQQGLDLLAENSVSHCEVWGGYPDDVDSFAGRFIVASNEDEAEPVLRMYSWENFLSNYNETKEYAKEEDIDFEDALEDIDFENIYYEEEISDDTFVNNIAWM